MTTAKTQLVVIVLITYCSTNTFMLTILVMKFGLIRGVTVLLQPFKVDPFSAKYFNKILFFLILILYFHCTP